MNQNPIYLGDAIYAFYDGQGIELRLNHHLSPCLIYLEPEVLQNLFSFCTKIQPKSVSAHPVLDKDKE